MYLLIMSDGTDALKPDPSRLCETPSDYGCFSSPVKSADCLQCVSAPHRRACCFSIWSRSAERHVETHWHTPSILNAFTFDPCLSVDAESAGPCTVQTLLKSPRKMKLKLGMKFV